MIIKLSQLLLDEHVTDIGIQTSTETRKASKAKHTWGDRIKTWSWENGFGTQV